MDKTLPPLIDPARELRLETALDVVGDAVIVVEPDWTLTLFNRASEEYFGIRRSAAVGRNVWELFPGSAESHYGAALRQTMADRSSTVFETPSVLKRGAFIRIKIAPVCGAGLIVSLVEVTDRLLTEHALRAERDRTAAILESISDAFYTVDRDWRLTYVNRIAEAWWGLPRESLIGKSLWDIFPGAVGGPTHVAHIEAAREGKVVRLEAQAGAIDRWLDISVFPIETGLSVFLRDITERKLAERRQQMLVNELNHRVKNTLTVIQAIARQTLREGRDIGPAREAFTDRILALAGAHDVITQERWAGAGLEEVIQRVVTAQIDRPERLQYSGPPVTLVPKTALSLALALHELLTNALKYGSLSGQDGGVELTWRASEAHERRRLHLRWREHGGPPVTPPARRGFGSRLIERGLPVEMDGEVRLLFAREGVVCEIDAELPASDTLNLPV
jgi:PAS domain S-box-containing protein